MAEDIKGDVYYIDPYGNQWKIVRKPAERHPKDWYWHADIQHREFEAHRVSVSMHRLLTGIDAIQWESGHDGDSQESGSNTKATHRTQGNNTNAGGTQNSVQSNRTTERYGTESRRQAHLY